MRLHPTLLVASLVLAGGVGLGFAPASYDDGYITYRYADNLARGRGFVFNPDEPVLGTSAPGYGLLLAALERAAGPGRVGVDGWGAVIFLVALASLPLSLAGALRRLNSERPELVAGGFALLAVPARWNAELMGCEALPILALVAAAFVAGLDGRELTAGALAGVATALRFDAALAVAALAVALWVDRRRLPWRFTLTAALPPACCALWLATAFGSILPNTLAGKRSELALFTTGYGRAELDWWVRSFGWLGALAIAGLALVGALALARRSGRARRFALAVAVWLLAHEVLYRVVGVPFAPWYHIASFNALMALAAAGAASLLPRRGEWAAAESRLRPLGRVALAGLLAGTALAGTARFYLHTWGRPPDPRVRLYRDVADELRRRAAPEARVAAVEIGALAFFGDRPVIDLVGLVDPQVLTARSEGRIAELLAARPPDYVVDNPNFHATFLAPFVASSELARNYVAVATFVRPEFAVPVRLLARREPPAR